MQRAMRAAFAALVFIHPLTKAQTNPACSYDFAPVTALAQNAVNNVPLNGASLLLIKDGQVLYERHFGSYNANTVVFLASASKWLAGATLMTLVDEGKLSLDDPASKYLPYFSGVKGTMTLRQMFSHTSGLPSDSALTGQSCLNDRQTTTDACAREIATLNLIGPPGRQFAYGGNSMQVAGRICEIVSGKTWEELFQEKIAGPLGMSGATFGAGGNPLVAGGARARARDYANLLQMLLDEGVFNGKRILSAAAVREMQKDQTFGVPIVFSPHTQYGNGQFRYGVGEWLDVRDADGNSIQVSSQGAFGFSPWLDKQRRSFGVFMVQNQLANVYATVAQIQQQVRVALDACAAPVVSVSAASFAGGELAAETITAAFGANLTGAINAANGTPLPTMLAGASVRVRDSAGADRLAPLFFAAPAQINYLIPAGTANGAATVTVTGGNGSLSIGTLRIASVAPGVFAADASGKGLAAAVVLRVRADGAQVFEPVARFEAALNKFSAVPIEVSNANEQVFLLLFGTGWRKRSQLSGVSVRLGGMDGPVSFAGAQGDLAGLDQLNVQVPRALAGRGEIEVALTVDGNAANLVKVAIK